MLLPLLAALLLAPGAQSPEPPRAAEGRTDGCALGHIEFAQYSAELDETARRRLDQVSLSAPPSLLEVGGWIHIGGHIDDREAETGQSTLAQRRGEAIRDYLVQHGTPAERLRLVDYQATRPAVDVEDRHRPITSGPELEAARADNRIAEVVWEAPIEVFRRVFPPGEPIC
jgi:outer membrane protein OmpA-like peptidoglycan-associated protein